MKISTNSWHYRLSEWTYGYGGVSRNLCPYFDKLVLAVIFSPLLFIGREVYGFLDNLYYRLSYNIRETISVIIVLSVITVPFVLIGLLLTLPYAFIIFPLTFWGSILLGLEFVKLISIINWPSISLPSISINLPKREKKIKPPKPVKIKRPNVFIEWLKAKHDKICPYIEFEN